VPTENEIKLSIGSDLDGIRRRIHDAGFEVHKKRIHEMNTVFDTPGFDLRKSDKLLRLRQVGDQTILTYKGPPRPGKHKSREELELTVSDGNTFQEILAALGYAPAFRYEKFRTEYQQPAGHGVLTVDETPIGNFLELEGSPDWVDGNAKLLGFKPSDYITKSYGALYLAYSAEKGISPTDMVFSLPLK